MDKDTDKDKDKDTDMDMDTGTDLELELELEYLCKIFIRDIVSIAPYELPRTHHGASSNGTTNW
jgi:hypothetical protein